MRGGIGDDQLGKPPHRRVRGEEEFRSDLAIERRLELERHFDGIHGIEVEMRKRHVRVDRIAVLTGNDSEINDDPAENALAVQ